MAPRTSPPPVASPEATTTARATPASDRCPQCNGRLYQLDQVLYCPAEDPHPGGLIVYADGGYRTMMRVTSKGNPHPS